MKVIFTGLILLISSFKINAQSDEAQQLLLNVEKLAQLKSILKNMYSGYRFVSKGYNTIKEIAEGNFNIHEEFLNGLLQVSPAVKNYVRVKDIIKCQSYLLIEYKDAIKRFRASNLFTDKELEYMIKVYKNVLTGSIDNIQSLLVIMTSGKLRMGDEERLQAINHIYDNMIDRLGFLRSFNKENNLLALQRGRELMNTKITRKLNGL